MKHGAAPSSDIRGDLNVTGFFDFDHDDPEAWPFGDIEEGSADLLFIDAPWPTVMRSPRGEGKSHTKHYGSMSFEKLRKMPIRRLASRKCVAVVFCTWPLLLNGGDPKRHFKGADASYSPIGHCLKDWGFRYVTGGCWHKKTVHGKTAFGTGYRLRSACEPFLIGTIGSPATTKSERNLIEGLAREHSRKPEEAYQFCERWYPGARKLELFSRRSRKGWNTWGYEAGKFDPVVTRAAA